MEMRLNTCDIYRLKQACKLYQEKTGSEWMWEQYETLVGKLEIYKDQYSTD